MEAAFVVWIHFVLIFQKTRLTHCFSQLKVLGKNTVLEGVIQLDDHEKQRQQEDLEKLRVNENLLKLGDNEDLLKLRQHEELMKLREHEELLKKQRSKKVRTTSKVSLQWFS